MKILVLNNAVPFVWGGAEELGVNLVQHLNAKRGVEAELLRLPFSWEPAEQIVNEILVHRQLELVNTDRVIALKFPAYLVRHAHKTLWVLHQFRQAYDLLEGGQSHLDQKTHGEVIDAVRAADDLCFDEAQALFVNSPVTRDRMRRFNDRDPQVLYPPLNDAELFMPSEPGNYLFAGGRIARGKRQHLLIEAMHFTSPGARLVVAGPCDDTGYADELRALVATHGLQDRVELRIGLMPRTTVAELVNGALACAYIPYDEDSLGYVTMEAFAAAKPVVTTDDAGGLLEIVRDGETGFVAEPDAVSLGIAFERLFDQQAQAAEMGRAAHASWTERNITWDATIDRLLEGG